jgi:hypothetical protein
VQALARKPLDGVVKAVESYGVTVKFSDDITGCVVGLLPLSVSYTAVVLPRRSIARPVSLWALECKVCSFCLPTNGD